MLSLIAYIKFLYHFHCRDVKDLYLQKLALEITSGIKRYPFIDGPIFIGVVSKHIPNTKGTFYTT